MHFMPGCRKAPFREERGSVMIKRSDRNGPCGGVRSLGRLSSAAEIRPRGGRRFEIIHLYGKTETRMGVGGISIWQLLIVLVIVVLLFGTKRLKNIGADLGEAIKGFRSSMSGGDKEEEESTGALEQSSAQRTSEPQASAKPGQGSEQGRT